MCERSGLPLEAIVRDAIHREVKRRLANMLGPLEGRGIEGSADPRIQQAYNRLVREGWPLADITPHHLKSATDPPTSWRTAGRWLRKNKLGSFSPEALGDAAKSVPPKASASAKSTAAQKPAPAKKASTTRKHGAR